MVEFSKCKRLLEAERILPTSIELIFRFFINKFYNQAEFFYDFDFQRRETHLKVTVY